MEGARKISWRKKYLLILGCSVYFLGGKKRTIAQEDESSRIRVNVVLVQLNVAVTDRKGNTSVVSPGRFCNYRGQDS